MDILSKINALIHDSVITSYIASFEDQTLQLNTRNLKKEISIVYSGLLAHKFENVINNNIIFEISEVSIEEFMKYEEKNLLESTAYGFLIVQIGSIEELARVLIEKEYRVFYMISSLGLTGYIIAKDISIVDK